MNTPNLTPDRVTAAIEAAAAAASRRWESTPNRAAYVHVEIRRAAHEAAEAASSIAVAGTLRTLAAALDRRSPSLAAILRQYADGAENGFESPADGSVVSTEGSGHGPGSCASCGATVWSPARPWTDDYRRLVLGPREPTRTLTDDERAAYLAEASVHPQPSAGPWTGPRPTLTSAEDRPIDTPEGDTTDDH